MGGHASLSAGTEKDFGFEWDIYREILPAHKGQFLEWIQPVGLSFFKGKRFLDAGCGIGRNSLWPLQAGAASAVAFDFDERTVRVARENLKVFPQCEVSFRSVYDIAFQDEFDAAFCIGVLHHLARPRAAVENLVRAVKPGGTLILWVYGREGNEGYLLWFNPLRAFVSRFLPLPATRALAKVMTLCLTAYLRLPHRSPYLRQLRGQSFRHNEAIVFDQLLPPIAHYWRKEEALALVEGLPVKLLHLTHTKKMSWTLVLEKLPAGSR